MYSSKEKLAKIIELDPEEFDKWCRIATYKVNRRYPAIKVIDMVSVPNVLICADIMRGGGLYGRVVNLGGSIGTFLGVDLLTYGYKIVKADTVSALLEALELNIENIWGIIIYAHGNPVGYIATPSTNIYTTQKELIYKLHKNGYKIAYAYLMQCFSGYEGNVEIKNMNVDTFNDFIDNYFDKRIMKNYISKFENGRSSVTFTIDWHMEWSIISNRVWDYQDMNVLTIDMKFFLPETHTIDCAD
ncbi:MAG: hypothetical protein A2017_08750 [Lentisphaerae bacterium GWF2_44_16]|nr:MAG: hypothetical protein A2017_08750 [Lentisphaerae bacterium GWF2_44_16]